MKISLNELRKYTDIDLPADELIVKIGAQLGEVEEVIDLSKKYQGIVIAKVISCNKHPNADKLSLCIIDNGKEKVQVVCGAPNVRTGLSVAWLPPGATVPATFDKDPLVLGAREIRGELSNGMLASANELGIGDDHSGILELDAGQPGDDFAKVFGLDDYIINIENKMFTHRPDCFGLLGVAREISGIQQKIFTSPDWYLEPNTIAQSSGDNKLLQVKNELPELVSRFVVQIIQNVEVKPSPLWLQIYLAKIGMKPINNIVDVTNYAMHLTGQPLHAYDYNKLKQRSGGAPTIIVRKPQKGEQVKVLGGKIIEPHAEAIMIATDKQLIGIGGVIGGADTEVDNSTKNIVLECASFDLYSIRRTSMTHGLFTDAVTRFSKGQSPLQNKAVCSLAVKEIMHQAGGNAVNLIDSNNLESEAEKRGSVHKPVEISAEFINSRLGIDLNAQDIVKILHSVEFVAENTRGDVLVVKAPFWRTDIEIAEDIVEEVGRLYGYDNLLQDLPKRSIVPVGPDKILSIKAQLRSQLASMGANEVQTHSFAHANLLEKAGQDKDQAFKIGNALSPDLQYYRLSLTPNLLDKVHSNIKAGFDKFAIFELGKTHSKTELDKDGLPREFERAALVFADKETSGGAAYFQAVSYINSLVYSRFKGVRFEPLSDCKLLDHKMFSQMVAPYDPDRSAVLFDSGKPLGVVGEFTVSVQKMLKLPSRSAGFELFLSPFLAPELPSYSPLSKYPVIEQDITLRTNFDMPFAEIVSGLDEALRSNAPGDVQAAASCIGVYSKDTASKHTTFRITALSHERTLTSEAINKLMDKIADELKTGLKAERI